MWHKITAYHLVIILIASIVSTLMIASISAQDSGTETPEPTAVPTEIPTATPTVLPTEVPDISVAGLQPSTFVEGVGGELTISGANFTDASTVSLNNSIPLAITSRSENTLVASVGSDVPAGSYTVEVSDVNSSAAAPETLAIIEPTAVPQLTVTQTEPAKVTAGQVTTLSILGTNFSASTTVRLVGYGFLTVDFVNSGALTASLPSNLPNGKYVIEVSDTTYGTATAPNTLTVRSPAVTATPAATTTPIPGQPDLIINSFSANPSSIYPGGTTQLTLQVLNVGSRTAEGVVISLGDSKFSPANGQSSVSLPDLASGAYYAVTLSVTAPVDASEGTQSISFVISSRDFSGQTYTDNATASVVILTKPTSEAQIVLDSFRISPDTAAPGDSVTIQALFKNTGTAAANQVLVQLDSANAVLIAGSNGSAFSIGDMSAGSAVPLVMKLMVSSEAQSGIQAQSFTISYLQDDASKQSTASISLNIETVVTTSPLILLQAYSTGQDTPLQPGQQFSFNMTLQNAGTVDVSTLLVTFGTVSTSTSSTAQTTPSTTTTTSNTGFAIYGSGGTLLAGDLADGNSVTLTQDFIVNNDLTSGIHDLPITLQYQEADGTVTQQSLDASLFVVVPATLRITSTSTLDDPLTAGTETTLALKIANLGSSQVNLTTMRVTGDNAEIGSGASVTLDAISGNDDTTKTVTFTPQAEDSYTVTVAVDYIDDLNQTQTLTQEFSGQVEASTQQTRPTPPNFQNTQQNASSENIIGRLLLGFLGFGG